MEPTARIRSSLAEDVVKAGILIIILLVGFVLGRISVGPIANAAQPAPTASRGGVGKKLNLPGVDWHTNRRTVLMVLQTTCHFCRESLPFYRNLVEQRGKFGGTRFVAVLPQTVEESSSYLENSGVKVDEVLRAPIRQIGVSLTPTLLVVNDEGVVVQEWVGKLEPNKESEVAARLSDQ